MIKGFDCIAASNPQIMILGSLPSVKSLKQNEYYAHPSNRFWPILSKIYQMPIDSYEQKQDIIIKNKLLLWDVIQKANREGSLDSKIKDVIVNPIDELISLYPSIKRIICNGKKSYSLYQKYFKQIDIECIYLPSTSSANQSIKAKELYELWEKALKKPVITG